jgi:hypothetical protein
VARVDDIALVDMPADDRGPRCINCYFFKVEDAAATGRASLSIRLTARYGISAVSHSGLMLANLITLAHFSVSSAISLL